MAHFRIDFVNSAKIAFESIYVTGRKEPYSVIKKINGKDVADKYDYYYVIKPNKYGIKWVIVNKDHWLGSDISATGDIPRYDKVVVTRLYK